MEIVIENLTTGKAAACEKFLKDDLRKVLHVTDIKVESGWVDVWRKDDIVVEEVCYDIVFTLPDLDDYAMNVLTHAFVGTGFEFFAPELGMRWAIA